MPTIRIEGPADSRLAPYFNLRSGKSSPSSFIVESSRLVERLLVSPFTTHSLLVTEGKLAHFECLVSSGVPIFVGSAAELKEIAGFNMHRGCLAHVGAPSTTLEDNLTDPVPGLVVIMQGLADPANVGSIIRNAAAFGADLVIADPKGASPFTRKAARTSAGHIFTVPIAVADPAESIAKLRRSSPEVEIIATTGHRDALPMESLSNNPCKAVIFGNEGHGVTDQIRQLADSSRTVALADGVDSLNVAAASALVLYLAQQSIAPAR